MKKFIIAVMCAFCVVGAYAAGENERATSVGYVAEELETRQDKFNKLGADTAMTYSGSTDGAIGTCTITGDLGAETNTTNTALPTVGAVNTKVANKQDELNFAANTVLMDTGISGEPAAKGIYQSSGDYNTQTDSLVEAATFNAALQNAINSEFTCAQRKDPNDPTSKCLLFNIFAPTQNLIIPNTYTRLEYLESTGTEYIDSGVEAKPGTVVKTKFQIIGTPPSNTDRGFLGCYGSSGYPSYYLYLHTFHGSVINSWLGTGVNSLFVPDHDEHTLEFDENGNVNFDGTHIDSNVYANSIDGPNIGIFRSIHLYSYTMPSVASRFYYVKLDNGTIRRDFIPAKRNSDGELGMYDTVSGTFFTNAGTGTFIAGPELSSNIYLPMN